MKTTPQQNKAIVPILIVVLLGLLSRIVTMLRNDDGPPPVVTPVQAVAPTASSARPLALLQTATARDPFFHPSLLKTEQAATTPGSDPGLPRGIAADQPPGKQSPNALALGIAPLTPMDMMAPVPSPAITQSRQFDTRGVARPGTGGNTTGQPGQSPGGGFSPSLATTQGEIVARLKLKAILAGDRPAAVIEGYGAQPLIVHQGETFGTLTIDTIRAAEIVLSGTQGIWTLPLDTTPMEPGLQSDARKEDTLGGTH